MSNLNDLSLIKAALQSLAPGVKIEPKIRECWLVDDPKGDLWDEIQPSRDDLEARREAQMGDAKSKIEREDGVL